MRRIASALALPVAAVVLSCGTIAGCARSQLAAVAPADQVAALEFTELVVGQGTPATPGSRVTVHYTGWLHDPAAPDQRGKKFDSSRDRNEPFSFPLGAAHVIKGWEQGVPGMKVDGVRQLVIPPALGYGGRNIDKGLIPPFSTLVFEIELLAVETVTLTPQAR